MRRYETIGYQQDAVDAACALFAGGRRLAPGEPQRLTLTQQRLRANLAAVQTQRGLPTEPALTLTHGAPQLTVEMETGTGKTLVYLTTIRRLIRDHGLRKFLIIVPSLAIREGVLAAVERSRDHLDRTVGRMPLPTWAHSRRELSRVRTFCEDPDPQVLILNIQALDKDQNLLNRSHDDFGGRAPIDLLAAARPVLILDEPQKLDGPKARAALASLNPVLTLRYSATHRTRHHPIHRFGPTAAVDGGWVKRITVDPVAGDPEDPAVVHRQLHRTVEHHLRRVRAQARRPVSERCKVLSLVFLRRVAQYTHDEGVARRAFESAWAELTAGPFSDLDLPAVERVHAGFFARDRRGDAKDTGGRSAADAQAYAVIAREQERLLDPAEPLQVVFTHSALREGWDNPNVFQICTLDRSRSTIRKRQEVGRGLRLPLQADGRRCRDPDVAELTVVTNEAYEDYVRSLQAEIRQETGDDFGGRTRDERTRISATRQAPQEAIDRLSAILAPRCGFTLAFDTAALADLSLPRGELSGPPSTLTDLQAITGLSRGTIRGLLDSTDAWPADPDALQACGRVLLEGVLDLACAGVSYRVSDGQLPDLFAREISGFPDELASADRAIHGRVRATDGAERAAVESLDARTDVVCFGRLPTSYTVPSPLGPLHPGYAAILTDGSVEIADPTPGSRRRRCLAAWAACLQVAYPPST